VLTRAFGRVLDNVGRDVNAADCAPGAD